LHASEAFICKAFKGEAIVKLCFALNNTADGSLRLARRVKINEIKGLLSTTIEQYLFLLVKFARYAVIKKILLLINFHTKFR